MKAEIGTTMWETREAARADVFRYVEVEYNRSRLRRHPDYGYVTPLETRSLLRCCVLGVDGQGREVLTHLDGDVAGEELP
ncbi:hypothetical protein [Streptomyces noursei]|uniref:hypothetical protein n=1 Tax=Streptomyces noursei TaxID=1971 RepID=UPI0030F2F9CE